MPAGTNEPAFPNPEKSRMDFGTPTAYPGLSKLEFVSALILAGCCADPGCTAAAIEFAVDWAEKLLTECAKRERQS